MPNRIEIIIKGDPDASQSQRGVVHPSKRRGRLGRRRLANRMRFWDLGMVSTGPAHDQWTMLDFQPSVCPFGTSSQTFNTQWHEELLDKIFETPVEQWSSHYKKIVPAMDYPVTISSQNPSTFASSAQYALDSSNPDFTDAGLLVPEDFYSGGKLLGVNRLGSDVIWFRSAFLQSGTSSGIRVTTEYDPMAAEVSFQPGRSCDVFLVPALPYALCRFEHAASGGSPYYAQQLNEFFYLPDRGIVLTPGHEMYGAASFVNFRNTSSAPTEGSQTEYDDFLAVADYFKGFTNARARYSTALPISYSSTDDGTNFGAVLPGTYSYTPPPPDTEGTVHMACSLNGNSANTANIGSSDNQILLHAVVRQGGTYYYIWNSENV